MGRLLDRIQFDLLLHGGTYKLYIEAALIGVLFYAGFTDFRTFRIGNNVVSLLLVLYVLFALVARTTPEIVSDVVLAVAVFAVLLWFYAQGVVGGGDVKFVSVACLWLGLHCALLFSLLLMVFIAVHVFAVWMGWAASRPMAGRFAIPYAPSVAGALIAIALSGCL